MTKVADDSTTRTMHDEEEDGLQAKLPPARPGRGPNADAMRRRLSARLFGAEQAPARIDRFEIIEPIGHGAMGEVFLAHDPRLDRRVALKCMGIGELLDDEVARWLMQEARALARLSHPNVVHVYDTDRYEVGVFIAMEYVEGRSLKDWLSESRPRWQAVVDAFLQAGKGLAAAHDVGIIHRDFKPTNVLVGVDGRVRVVDFGLAGGAGLAGGETDGVGSVGGTGGTGSLEGAAPGTPLYMAPEQHRGKRGDARSDLYSFCVALYEALYGVNPFHHLPAEQLQEGKENGDVATPVRCRGPLSLRRLVLKGLLPEPEQRHQSIDALLRRLRGVRSPVRRAVLPVVLGSMLLGGVAQMLWDQEGESEMVREQRLLAARAEDDPTKRAILLRAVPNPAAVPGWSQSARDVLNSPLSRAVLKGHDDAIEDIVALPGGRELLTCSSDGSVRRWDLASGDSEKIFQGKSALHELVVSPRHGWVFVVGEEGESLLVLDLNNEEQPDSLGSGVARVAIDPAEALVAYGDHYSEVRVLRLDSLEKVAVLPGTSNNVTSLEFGHDGKSLIVGRKDGVQVWDVPGFERFVTIDVDGSGVKTVPCPNRDAVVIVSPRGEVELWEQEPGGRYRLDASRDLHTELRSASVSPDGFVLAAATGDGRLVLLRIPGLEPHGMLKVSADRLDRVGFSPDGRFVSAVDALGNVFVWNLEKGDRPIAVAGRGQVEFGVDSRHFYTGGSSNEMREWSVKQSHMPDVLCCNDGGVPQFSAVSPDGQRVLIPSGLSARIWGLDGRVEIELGDHDGRIWGAAFSPDGTMVATTTSTGSVWIHGVGDGLDASVRLGTHFEKAREPVFSPDGSYLATVSQDDTVRLWPVEVLEGPVESIVLTGHSDNVRTVTFVGDGSRLVTTARDGKVWEWMLDDPSNPIELGRHDGLVEGVALSRDGMWIATASEDHTAGVWSMYTDAEPLFHEHPDVVRSVDFGPNGELLTVCGDHAVRIWWRGIETTTLSGVQGRVRRAVFSPTGDRVLTASYDNTVGLWDLTKSGTPCIELRGHDEAVWSGRFLGSEKVVTVSSDGSSRIWDAEIREDRLYQKMLDAVPWCLSAEEYASAFHEDYKEGQLLRDECELQVARIP